MRGMKNLNKYLVKIVVYAKPSIVFLSLIEPRMFCTLQLLRKLREPLNKECACYSSQCFPHLGVNEPLNRKTNPCATKNASVESVVLCESYSILQQPAEKHTWA